WRPRRRSRRGAPRRVTRRDSAGLGTSEATLRQRQLTSWVTYASPELVRSQSAVRKLEDFDRVLGAVPEERVVPQQTGNAVPIVCLDDAVAIPVRSLAADRSVAVHDDAVHHRRASIDQRLADLHEPLSPSFVRDSRWSHWSLV